MGRKRKSRAPVKITRSPKQAKQSMTPVKQDQDAIGTDDSSDAIVTDKFPPTKPPSPELSAPVPLDDMTEQNEASDVKPLDRVRQWMIDQQQQQQVNESNSIAELDENSAEEPLIEERYPLPEDGAQSTVVSEVPLRYRLKDYSEKQITNSVMYECEWLKCGFETTEDIEYLTHVESHLVGYMQGKRDVRDLPCLWDLCDFKTPNKRDLESHVHFHVYHNRMKTHGASLSNIISIPKCNSDSRRRNSIDMYRITFQCEWDDCDEVYGKAQEFFTHVNNHIQDQFPIDKRSTKEPMMCQWAACKQTYKRCSIALEHVRRHSTERTIGCYTCGALFVSRLKYIDHCKRQVEYHNREYPCTQCNKLFATKQLMVDHKNIHNKKYPCTLCPMKWPSRKALSYHIRYRHVEEKPFECHVCHHRCVTKSDLNEHVLTHDERRMFRCEEFGCDAAYKCQKSLKKHVDSVHYGMGPMMYACHLCLNQYKSGANLSKHLTKIHRYQKPPGYNRFTYQADRDGVFRLSTFVTGEKVDHSDDECKSEPLSQDSMPTKEDKKEETPTWTSFSIEKLEAMTRNTISIELKANEVLPKASPPAHPPSRKHSSTQPILPVTKSEASTSTKGSKSVDDYTVMKRYIKEEKTVVISFEETDSAGSVIRSETVQTTELTPDKLLSSGL
ncbi:histone H4 transcription factor isoform X2 [Topomyia yanbarensis]|uniref:histone H4 transcription factor isoform X2 n=1 Tax=Topomyia yanbarensis TaxID=2498891 RepID=UPI00273B2BF2|nr:histone H4 transcription factor isoform X2 [Topomyia yanbarensis]